MPRYSKTTRKNIKKTIKCDVPECPTYSATFKGLGKHMEIYHRHDFNLYSTDCPICPFAINKKVYSKMN